MNKLKAGDTSAHVVVVFAGEGVGLACDTRHDEANGRKYAVGSFCVVVVLFSMPCLKEE